jgi:hypothetical protein
LEIRLNVRYTLRDRELLRKLMEHPGRGAPYSTRTLAAAATLRNHHLVHRLLDGKHPQETCDMDEAHRIAEALGVAVLVLFAPPASPNPPDSAMDQKPPTSRSVP